MSLLFAYTIPMLPPSLNKFLGRENAWEYRELKKVWKTIVAAYCKPRPQRPFDNVVVTVRYFFPTRTRRDPDNYTPKLILDGLTECGILRDDSFKCIDLEVKGGYDKDNPRTEISIWRRTE